MSLSRYANGAARNAQCAVSARSRRSRRFAAGPTGGEFRASTHVKEDSRMDTTLQDATQTVKTQLTKLRWAIGINGALAVALGVVIIIWPSISLYSLVVVFGA